MRFDNGQQRYYCGVDLHTKRMYLCILDHDGVRIPSRLPCWRVPVPAS
jgi:hypothetical protein